MPHPDPAVSHPPGVPTTPTGKAATLCTCPPAKPRGVVDAVTMTAGKPGKSKVKLTLVRPNGHRTDIATTKPLTDEMLADAEGLIGLLTTGKRQAPIIPADLAVILREHAEAYEEWLGCTDTAGLRDALRWNRAVAALAAWTTANLKDA